MSALAVALVLGLGGDQVKAGWEAVCRGARASPAVGAIDWGAYYRRLGHSPGSGGPWQPAPWSGTQWVLPGGKVVGYPWAVVEPQDREK